MADYPGGPSPIFTKGGELNLNAALQMGFTQGREHMDITDEQAATPAQPGMCRGSPRAAALIYAENRLFPWAKWARENREKLGVPTVSLLYKAMQSKSVPMRRVHPNVISLHGENVPALTARGKETRSFRPTTIGEVPEAIVEVDEAVGALPPDLHEVLIADFFTYGPIEVRCRRTRWRRARFSQLLEAAKYAVYAHLMAKASGKSIDDLR